MSIQTRGFDSLLKTLDKLKDDALVMQDKGIEFIAGEGHARSYQVAPVRTGFLKANIVLQKEDLCFYRDVSHAEYSLFVEYGFQHYRNGFIPGAFYMQQGASHAEAIVEEGALEDLLQVEIDIRVVSPTDD